MPTIIRGREVRCKTCIFCCMPPDLVDTPGAKRRECHRHPPLPVPGRYAFITENDWCGEYLGASPEEQLERKREEELHHNAVGVNHLLAFELDAAVKTIDALNEELKNLRANKRVVSQSLYDFFKLGEDIPIEQWAEEVGFKRDHEDCLLSCLWKDILNSARNSAQDDMPRMTMIFLRQALRDFSERDFVDQEDPERGDL